MCHDELIQLYVDGALTPTERSVFSAHLADCPACRRELTAYKALLWDLEHPSVTPAPPELQAGAEALMAAWETAQAADAAAASPGLTGLRIAWSGVAPVARPALTAAWWTGSGLARVGRIGLTGLWRLVRRGGGRR